jgi:hypothetical protein
MYGTTNIKVSGFLSTLKLPNLIPSVIGLILVAGKVFTHNCDIGKLSVLIQGCNIVQQIEREGFQLCQT